MRELKMSDKPTFSKHNIRSLGVCPRRLLVGIKDAFGNITRICYNAFNAPVTVTDANGIVTDCSYFGESLSNSNVQPSPVSAERSGDGTFNLQPFYIGKPAVEGVGKWQTADPMGYPENAPQKLCFGGKPRAQRSARRARKGPRCDCAQGSFPQELANLLNVPVVACDTKVEYVRAKDSATGEETVVVKAVLNNPLDQSVHWIRFNPE